MKRSLSPRKAGYQEGWSHGYHHGCCQSVLQAIQPLEYPVRQLRVLYIRQGFEAIDSGVSDALSTLVSEFFTGDSPDLLRLAVELRPDLVLVMNGLHVFPDNHLQMVAQVRELGIRTAIWFADDPYFTDLTPPIALQYDYVFTHESSCIELYLGAGCRQVHYLPLAASSSIYHPMAVEMEFHSDICFIGNAFPNRIDFFNRISPFLMKHKVAIIGALWDRLNDYELLADQIKLSWTPIEETVKYYNGAKIVINLHRGAVDPLYSKNGRNLPGYSINPRTYEISACGAFQMTDIRDDLGLYYSAGSEIVTFSSPEEFIDRASYYLVREAERNQIAVKGLNRTIREHTFHNRLTRLLDAVFGPSGA